MSHSLRIVVIVVILDLKKSYEIEIGLLRVWINESWRSKNGKLVLHTFFFFSRYKIRMINKLQKGCTSRGMQKMDRKKKND